MMVFISNSRGRRFANLRFGPVPTPIEVGEDMSESDFQRLQDIVKRERPRSAWTISDKNPIEPLVSKMETKVQSLVARSDELEAKEKQLHEKVAEMEAKLERHRQELAELEDAKAKATNEIKRTRKKK